jgi:hypothetical protein
MLFAYLVLGVATLAFMLVRVPDPRKRADYVNTLAILHSAAYLAVTVLAMFSLVFLHSLSGSRFAGVI